MLNEIVFTVLASISGPNTDVESSEQFSSPFEQSAQVQRTNKPRSGVRIESRESNSIERVIRRSGVRINKGFELPKPVRRSGVRI